MPKTEFEREKICEIAKHIATSVYSKRCTSDTCLKCENYGDCTPIEMAYQIFEAGYKQSFTISHNVDPAAVEDLAKTIAASRGYGCDYRDSCQKCTCRIVQCIPLTISEVLTSIGYTKENKEV